MIIEPGHIYNMDCLEGMRDMPDNSVNAVITDPPYGVNCDDWDKQIPPRKFWDEMGRIASGPLLIFGAATMMHEVLNEYPKPQRIIIWHTPYNNSMINSCGMFYRWHPIYAWNLPKSQKVIHQDIIQQIPDGHCGWFHPGTKPIQLMTRLVDAFGGDIVCDPFMGSGTTAVACVRTGRQYIGFEMEKKYCDIAEDRIYQETRQLRLFTG